MKQTSVCGATSSNDKTWLRLRTAPNEARFLFAFRARLTVRCGASCWLWQEAAGSRFLFQSLITFFGSFCLAKTGKLQPCQECVAFQMDRDGKHFHLLACLACSSTIYCSVSRSSWELILCPAYYWFMTPSISSCSSLLLNGPLLSEPQMGPRLFWWMLRARPRPVELRVWKDLPSSK